jgi:glycosyltransferase involved in cell wall biosynthesis
LRHPRAARRPEPKGWAPAGASGGGDDLCLRGRRIAVDARYLRREGVGIAIGVDAVVRALVSASAEITLLTDIELAELSQRYPSCQVVSLQQPRSIVWEQVALPRFLRRAHMDLYLAPANKGVPLLYRGPTPCVALIHDLIPLRFWRRYLVPRPLFALPYLVGICTTMGRADTILTISEATASDIRGMFRRHATVIPYDISKLGPGNPPGSVPAPAGRYFVYNGGYDPRKNVAALIQAFALLRARMRGRRMGDLGLVLMGDSPPLVGELVASAGIGEAVTFTGYVSEAEKGRLLAGAIAVVYPSEYEGFGLPLVEAFLTGVPVISGTGGALREVGGDAPVYVEVDSPPSIAAAMEELLEPEARQRRIQMGDRRVDELLSANAPGALVRLLCETLDRSGALRGASGTGP